MKTASGALINHLAAQRQFIMAEVYTITLLSGTVLRYTSGASDLVWGGQNYSASGLLFKRSPIRTQIGFDANECEVEFIAEPTVTIPIFGQNVPIHQAVMRGEFDKATFLVERLFMPTYGDTVTLGGVIMFSGEGGEADPTRLGATFRVKGGTHKLDQQLPRNINQSACPYTLFDSRCQLVKSAFKTSKLVLAGSTTLVISATVAFANAPPFYDLGSITFTSGPNNGLSRTIKTQLSTTDVLVHLPFPYAPVAGNGFDVYPGCDKAQVTCGPAKFNNLVNFGGKPYIPVPETAI